MITCVSVHFCYMCFSLRFSNSAFVYLIFGFLFGIALRYRTISKVWWIRRVVKIEVLFPFHTTR